ncbi:addiction module protein [candidate division KSB1 bacterium]|nr:addiction module protein [candidate division KSB1 bacterium]MBL7094354.1 addiction module protein [candidate division KSB1 bacterium]
MDSVRQLADKAISLKPVERLQLVDTILQSLDEPDAKIERLWIKEADARYEAYKRGELNTTDWDDINEKYEGIH